MLIAWHTRGERVDRDHEAARAAVKQLQSSSCALVTCYRFVPTARLCTTRLSFGTSRMYSHADITVSVEAVEGDCKQQLGAQYVLNL
jgi:hypothetical protein